MPALSFKTKHYYREHVRSALVQNPMVSGEGIRRALESQGLVLDRHYVNKLVKEIPAERARLADTWTLNFALTSFQDVMAEIVGKAWDIVNDPFAERSDRLAAIREIRAAHNDVFEKLFDAGVFQRKLGTLDATIRNIPLPAEKKEQIAFVFRNWGLLLAPVTEPVKPTVAPSQEDAKPAEPASTA
jgi:hypothetical protein